LTRSAVRRVAALGFLVVAVLLAFGTAERLSRLLALPSRSWPYYAAFATSIALALLGGIVARRAGVGEPVRIAASRPFRCRLVFRCLAAASAAFLLFSTWRLQSLPDPPLRVFLFWFGGVLATVLAFPAVRVPREIKTPPVAAALLAIALVAAAAARVTYLGRAPGVYSGDEASQALDGQQLLDGVWRGNPFGTGWYSSMRLGMLPAGEGARLSSNPVAGARLPYAVIGTLSVAATAAAGAAAAGPWGAAAAAALLAFAPHHVHFSRLSSIMIIDALFVPLIFVLLISLRRTGSPRTGALAGAVAGLSLYGYAGGRVVPVVLLLTVPVAVRSSPASGRRRGLVLAALLLGFLAAGGPNLRFAHEHFDDWNGRFRQVSVFTTEWRNAAKARWGTPLAIATSQFNLGAIGLLSVPDTTSWFTGHPLIGPPLLVGVAAAGLGWLLGRGRRYPAAILVLLAAGNLAGVVLTSGAPTVQRASSLLPVLAILGGTAVAGFLDLIPEPPSAKAHWRTLAGTFLVAGYFVLTASKHLFDPDRSPRYAGERVAFAQSAARILQAPRWREVPVFLHGMPYISTDLPTFHFFLPGKQIRDIDPTIGTGQGLAAGVHIFCSEYVPAARRLQTELGLRPLSLPHPADPQQEVGLLLLVARPAPPKRAESSNASEVGNHCSGEPGGARAMQLE
jgi:hypothetical protein